MVPLSLAKVPCKHIVELARADVLSNPQSSRLVKEFARIRPDDAEVAVHALLRRNNLVPNVPIDHACLGEGPMVKEFPFIKMSSWVRQLLETRRLPLHLCGVEGFEDMEYLLQEFWDRYEKVSPEHELFEMARLLEVDLCRCIPVYSHTDEGRSLKKEPLLVISCHGALGRGTQGFLKQRKHLEPLESNELGMNFIGSSLTSNFLLATMQKRCSNDHPEALEKLLEVVAEDMSRLIHEGVSAGGQHVRVVHLGTTGDLPALGKLGWFFRSFSHVPKRPSSRTASEGICHLCLGGQEACARTGAVHYPFEDLSDTPCWEETLNAAVPWEEEPVFLRGIPLNRKEIAAWFNVDLWHCFHLGVAKHWVASAYACIVESNLLPETSVESKFEGISTQYRAFCRQRKIAMWVTEITRDTLCWPQSSACPVGKWNKGSCSTTMMLFLDHFCQEAVVGKTDDRVLLLVVPSLERLIV